ncbi:MAG TPA: crosslink repair DNA glycosylase YcaQ family protein [Candidatus Limnocylindria bacterium]|nr:crosslink repair DNA glycosylase YcaQ family protein [Candidatus Limnocylindria bacterium]
MLGPQTARRIAVAAALLGEPGLKPTTDSVVEVARHFGGIQIDPTRTVERTQHLVLWSRIRDYDRALLGRVLNDHKAFEFAAFVVTPDRLPELRHLARTVYQGGGSWRAKAQRFIDGNAEFRASILKQLKANGPMQSRDFDDSTVKIGWESTGWTHGKNTTRMLEFMGVRLEVVVAGRVGQERLWDLPSRVLPRDAPRGELSNDAYQEARVMRAMARFGIATQQEIRLRAYGLSIPDAKALLTRLVAEGRLTAVRLALPTGDLDAFALPAALATRATMARTTLLSPFDPLVYDRDRTGRLFGFAYKLEMYKPVADREFGHFVLPILHDNALVGRLDSERDRKKNELVVRRLHWEGRKPAKPVVAAVNQAVDELREFVRTG